jgi:thioredoxin 1
MKAKSWITSLLVAASALIAGVAYACNPSSNASTEGEPITVARFDEIIGSSKLTMVDFYTTWCGPCKRMDPFVKQIAADMADQVTVLQIDAEAQMDIADRYHLQGYPTLIFFKGGQVVYTSLGYQDYEGIQTLVKRYK